MAAYGIFILGGWTGFLLALLFAGVSRNISDKAIEFVRPLTSSFDGQSNLTSPAQVTNDRS
ncbi:hypothetical protein HDF16_004624 [Granulicella aggregans]|jgi:hypothetical protein|uniref:Uncharacterized protein n=1 Tax=Granulicella aggregans TaxID=474949 RepID=A0A7W7ZH98_9BACT|nr:hypothetical protein [Granulicella aggregans]